MSDCQLSPSNDSPGLHPSTLGVVCCMTSAVLYAAANVCLRQLSASCEPGWAIWIVCIKESVGVLTVGPWLAYRLLFGLQTLPSRRSVTWLLIAGIATQLGGNVINFWAFGVVGLAVTTPVTQGMNLIASAILGWAVLGEHVSRRSMAAIAALIVAIVLLSLGASNVGSSASGAAGVSADHVKIALGVGAACLSGAVFAFLGISIRTTVTQATSPAVVVVMITGMGPLILGPLSAWQLGPAAMTSISASCLTLAVTAGLLNLLAFTSIIYGLKHTPIVHAYVITASQTALAALAGMLVFGESLTPPLLIGVAMVIAGMVIIDRPEDAGAV